MLYIKAEGQDYTFFREMEDKYPDIIVADMVLWPNMKKR